MATLETYNQEKQKVSKIELNDSIFAVEPKMHLLQNVVRMQLCNARQGTASCKMRAEMSGSRKKPYKQKGTGSARRGIAKSPINVGGAAIFGPVPRDYDIKVNRKASIFALKSSLSLKNKDGKIIILEDLDLKEPKTKKIVEILKKFGVKSAIISDLDNNVLARCAKNISNVRYLSAQHLNVYDVLKHDYLIMTRKSCEKINGMMK